MGHFVLLTTRSPTIGLFCTLQELVIGLNIINRYVLFDEETTTFPSSPTIKSNDECYLSNYVMQMNNQRLKHIVDT